jgi:hypothetical protein
MLQRVEDISCMIIEIGNATGTEQPEFRKPGSQPFHPPQPQRLFLDLPLTRSLRSARKDPAPNYFILELLDGWCLKAYASELSSTIFRSKHSKLLQAV